MADLPASHLDLLEHKGYAALATLGPTGYPQVTYVAYLFERDAVRISLNTTRQKTKNLARDPRCTLFLVDPNNAYRTLEIRADAELVDDADFSFAARAGAKYDADFRQNDAPGETRVEVVLHPLRVNARG